MSMLASSGQLYTEGGGCVLLHRAQGCILTSTDQTLVRVTVTGIDGRTTYVYCDRAQRDALVAALMAADLA